MEKQNIDQLAVIQNSKKRVRESFEGTDESIPINIKRHKKNQILRRTRKTSEEPTLTDSDDQNHYSTQRGKNILPGDQLPQEQFPEDLGDCARNPELLRSRVRKLINDGGYVRINLPPGAIQNRLCKNNFMAPSIEHMGHIYFRAYADRTPTVYKNNLLNQKIIEVPGKPGTFYYYF